MWKRKHEFKPDRTDSGTLSKLYITKKQRLRLLRWFLFALCLVVLSLVQDVAMCRIRLFGATTDLVSGGILLICMLISVDESAVFSLCAATIYYFTGFAAGPHAILLLTALGTLFNIFRHSYLRKSLVSTILCAGLALMVYELAIFLVALFLEFTTFSRIGYVCLSGLVTCFLMPLQYPVYVSVSKIGGESWKE